MYLWPQSKRPNRQGSGPLGLITFRYLWKGGTHWHAGASPPEAPSSSVAITQASLLPKSEYEGSAEGCRLPARGCRAKVPSACAIARAAPRLKGWAPRRPLPLNPSDPARLCSPVESCLRPLTGSNVVRTRHAPQLPAAGGRPDRARGKRQAAETPEKTLRECAPSSFEKLPSFAFVSED